VFADNGGAGALLGEKTSGCRNLMQEGIDFTYKPVEIVGFLVMSLTPNAANNFFPVMEPRFADTVF
jgi:hypothetical protein